MSDITIIFDNGKRHTYRNVPGDVTSEQILGRAIKDFPEQKIASFDKPPVSVQDNGNGVTSSLLKSAASLGDTLYGVVPSTLGMATYAASRAMQNSPEVSEQSANTISSAIDKPFGKAAGITEDPSYQHEASRWLMDSISNMIGKGSKFIADRTRLPVQDVENMLGTLSFAAPTLVGRMLKPVSKSKLNKASDFETVSPEEITSPIEQSIAPSHKSDEFKIHDIPVSKLKLSEDVPNFKKGANEKGEVTPLTGKFDRRGLAPIQVWHRLNGDLEIISGRHRHAHAVRNGEETIPAQVYKESDGFTEQHARILDAELNIKDEKGSVGDYANYFKNTGIPRELAESRGLLGKAKSEAGFSIANEASDEVYAAHSADKITDDAAHAIARTSPNNSAVQAVGLKMMLDGKSSINLATNTMRAVDSMVEESKSSQGDMFNLDTSRMEEAISMGKKAVSAQKEIRDEINTIQNPAKRSQIAAKHGIKVDDPKAVLAEVERLKAEKDRLDNWQTDPELVRRFRSE